MSKNSLMFTIDDAMRRLTHAHRKPRPKLAGHHVRAIVNKERRAAQKWLAWFGQLSRIGKTS